METSSEKRQAMPSIAPVLASGLAIAILYVLSSGPAFRWYGDRDNSFAALQTAYAPLVWVCDRNEFANRVMSWYGGDGYGSWKNNRMFNELILSTIKPSDWSELGPTVYPDVTIDCSINIKQPAPGCPPQP